MPLAQAKRAIGRLHRCMVGDLHRLRSARQQIPSSSAGPFTERCGNGLKKLVAFSDRYRESTNLMADSEGRPSARRARTDSCSDFLPRNRAAGPKFTQNASHGSADDERDMGKFTGDGGFRAEITKSGDRGFKWNCWVAAAKANARKRRRNNEEEKYKQLCQC